MHFKKIKLLLLCLITLIISISLLLYFILSVNSPRVKYPHIFYKQNSNERWVLLEPTFTPDFYTTKEAIRIGNNLLFYQSYKGGWGKDICMQNKINLLDKIYFKLRQIKWDPTIDNSATVTEIDFLSKLYNATGKTKYKRAVYRGLNYILSIQYINGGFPQKGGILKKHVYQSQITYNNKTMINSMQLLKKIVDNDEQYSFIDSKTRTKVQSAYERGLDCILKTQLPSGMWGAQYDKRFLIPTYARSYEPASIETRESSYIVLFLMSIDNPNDRVIKAITKACEWYNKKAVRNKTPNTFLKDGKYYLHLEDCQDCEPIWARNYDIEKNIPIFADKHTDVKFDVTEIEADRIFAYEWYVNSGNKVLQEYNNWKQKIK